MPYWFTVRPNYEYHFISFIVHDICPFKGYCYWLRVCVSHCSLALCSVQIVTIIWILFQIKLNGLEWMNEWKKRTVSHRQLDRIWFMTIAMAADSLGLTYRFRKFTNWNSNLLLFYCDLTNSKKISQIQIEHLEILPEFDTKVWYQFILSVRPF